MRFPGLANGLCPADSLHTRIDGARQTGVDLGWRTRPAPVPAAVLPRTARRGFCLSGCCSSERRQSSFPDNLFVLCPLRPGVVEVAVGIGWRAIQEVRNGPTNDDCPYGWRRDLSFDWLPGDVDRRKLPSGELRDGGFPLLVQPLTALSDRMGPVMISCLEICR